MKKIIKRLLLFTSAATIATSSIAYKLSHDTQTGFIKDLTDFFSDDNDFSIVAHRGFSSIAIENTKDALALANNTSYIDMIEFDIRLTNDDKLVLSHNNTVNTLKGKTIKISDSISSKLLREELIYKKPWTKSYINTLSEIDGLVIRKRFENLNNKTYKLITLSDAIDMCENKEILLDLKFNNDTRKFITALEEELKDKDIDNMTFQSSNLLALLCLEKEKKDYNYQAIINSKDKLNYISLFDNIALKEQLVTYKVIDELEKDNKNVSIWTINSVKELNSVLNKVDDYYKDITYITDYPDIINYELQKKTLTKTN